jgi:hypothetical protein
MDAMMIKTIYAAGDENVGPMLSGEGFLGSFSAGNLIEKVATVFSMIIGFLTIIGIIILLFTIISAGIMWMNSGGDPQKVEMAQKKLTNSFIGLILIIGAVFIVSLLGNLLFNVDLMDLGGLFERLSF